MNIINNMNRAESGCVCIFCSDGYGYACGYSDTLCGVVKYAHPFLPKKCSLSSGMFGLVDANQYIYIYIWNLYANSFFLPNFAANYRVLCPNESSGCEIPFARSPHAREYNILSN